jgi:hypothetical protein
MYLYLGEGEREWQREGRLEQEWEQIHEGKEPGWKAQWRNMHSVINSNREYLQTDEAEWKDRNPANLSQKQDLKQDLPRTQDFKQDLSLRFPVLQARTASSSASTTAIHSDEDMYAQMLSSSTSSALQRKLVQSLRRRMQNDIEALTRRPSLCVYV